MLIRRLDHVNVVTANVDKMVAWYEAALKLEHFAFSARDASAFERTLEEYGDPFKKIEVSGAGIIQFHVSDPDENHVHVDFDLNE